MNLFIASVVSPNGEQFKSDKNGNFPVMLNILAGRCPSKRVIAGTMAINMDIEPGQTYLFNWTEGEADHTYGRQFNFEKVKNVEALELIQAAKELGKSDVFDVTKVKAAVTDEAFTNPE